MAEGSKYPRPFLLERYFAEHEFTAPSLLCASDCESLPMSELVDMMSEDTRKLWDNLQLGYTDTHGHPKLREEIAKMYACDKITEDKVQILVPAEGIYVAMRSLLKPGDRVVATWPGYQSLTEIALAQGARVDHWEVRENEERGFYFDLEELDQLLMEPCKCVIVNFPHNPTGALPTHEEWEVILRLVAQSRAILFCDEMYRGLEYVEGDRLPSACTLYKRAIALSGMSKAYGMPGLRIGWLVSQDAELLSACAEYRDYCTICASGPAELLSIAGLENSDTFLARNKQRVLRTIEALEEMMRDADVTAHFTFRRPRAGPITLIGLRGGKSSEAYCNRLIKESGVLLMPTVMLEWRDNYMRIGFGRDSGPECVRLWHKAIKGGVVPH